MTIEDNWPEDSADHVFILRGIKTLADAGMSESEARSKILDQVGRNPDHSVRIAKPTGGWLTMTRDKFFLNQSDIFSEGICRTPKIDQRKIRPDSAGGAGFVYLPHQWLDAIAAPASNKGGAKPTYDMEFLKEEAMEWLAENGEPSKTKAGYGSQSQLIGHLQLRYATEFSGQMPSDSLLKQAKHAPAWIDEFRKSKENQHGH